MGLLFQALAENLCFAYVQADDIQYLPEILNFPNDAVIGMAEPQGANRALLPSAGNCVNSSYNPYNVLNASQLLQDYFVSTGRLKYNSSASAPGRPELGPRGVVLHSTPGGFDPQPPCAYYVKVVEEGNSASAFDHVLN